MLLCNKVVLLKPASLPVIRTLSTRDDSSYWKIMKLEKMQKKAIKSWNFPVDYNDHFETPFEAYEDIQPFLKLVQQHLNKDKSEFRIYDPYYCDGKMIAYLSKLGYDNVINRNTDFYDDITSKNIPEYDILITNPPYSGEHKQKLLNYLLSTQQKPFALLLPTYIASKSYWKQFLTGQLNMVTNMNKNTVKSKKYSPMSVYYVMPSHDYQYQHPEGTGKEMSPFYSSWFISLGSIGDQSNNNNNNNNNKKDIDNDHSNKKISIQVKHKDGNVYHNDSTKKTFENNTNDIVDTIDNIHERLTSLWTQNQSNIKSSTPSSLSSSSSSSFDKSGQVLTRTCSIYNTLDELIQHGYLSAENRPNPKSRKRLLAKIHQKNSSADIRVHVPIKVQTQMEEKSHEPKQQYIENKKIKFKI